MATKFSVDVHRVNFVWRITHEAIKHKVASDEFHADTDEDCRWRLIFNFVAVHLGPGSGTTSANIDLQHVDGSKRGDETRRCISAGLHLIEEDGSNRKLIRPPVWEPMKSGSHGIYGEEYMSGPLTGCPEHRLPEDVEIRIEVELMYYDPSPTQELFESLQRDCEFQRHSDVASFFTGESLDYDVTFMVQSKKVRANRNILSARSPVFKAMFGLNMMESDPSNNIKIEECFAEEFQLMIDFVHTGRLPDAEKFEEVATSLLMLGDRYQIPSLKDACQLWLSDVISRENVVEILRYAFLFRTTSLKTKALKFLLSKAKDIFKTECQKLFEELPDLAKEAWNLELGLATTESSH